MAFQVQQTIPILRMFDVARARELSVGLLGFTVDREHRAEEAPWSVRPTRSTDPFGTRLVFNEETP